MPHAFLAEQLFSGQVEADGLFKVAVARGSGAGHFLLSLRPRSRLRPPNPAGRSLDTSPGAPSSAAPPFAPGLPEPAPVAAG